MLRRITMVHVKCTFIITQHPGAGSAEGGAAAWAGTPGGAERTEAISSPLGLGAVSSYPVCDRYPLRLINHCRYRGLHRPDWDAPNQ